MSLWYDSDGTPIAQAEPCCIRVLRQDDNGNEYVVAKVSSRCEAEAMVAEYESRGHKQVYTIDEGR
jgi:hypothetical protein